MKEKIIEMIKEANLDRIQEQVIESLQYSIRVVKSEAGESQAVVGSSKIGDRPDVPPDFPWPRNNSGAPLAFMAQFNLEEVAPLDIDEVLPRKGMLYFFFEVMDQVWGFDPADRGNWKVVYYEDTSGLQHTNPPADLPEEAEYIACPVVFQLDVTLPPWESIFVDDLDLDEDESDEYFDLCERVVEVLQDDVVINRLLGYPDQIQGAMQLDCQLVSHGLYCGDSTGYNDPRRDELEEGALNWRLLFQLDSVEDAGMMWGDLGRLYFWIEENALSERDFDRVWMILQCS